MTRRRWPLQITASITFLPLLEDPCTFDLLVYTSKDSSVPDQWCVRRAAGVQGLDAAATPFFACVF
jgi:hypothetical protein